jgi:hypothetical protein
MKISRNVLIGIVAGIITAGSISLISSTSVVAQMGGHDMGGMSSDSMESMSMPGMTHQMCQPAGDMPPHYCEPTYHVMSSVQGIKISTVEPMDDVEVMLTLREIMPTSDGVSQKLVIVGGSGNLAGAIIVDEGWINSTIVHLPLTGTGTIYDYSGMSIHVFPYTG